jgi:hypothetical protein
MIRGHGHGKFIQMSKDSLNKRSHGLPLDMHGFFFSRMRVQVATAIAKAATARFVQDDVDDGLPIHTMYERKVADRALEMSDLPLYHVPS